VWQLLLVDTWRLNWRQENEMLLSNDLHIHILVIISVHGSHRTLIA
jgi:hypothetical protein